jgi:hypothetical protein
MRRSPGDIEACQYSDAHGRLFSFFTLKAPERISMPIGSGAALAIESPPFVALLRAAVAAAVAITALAATAARTKEEDRIHFGFYS